MTANPAPLAPRPRLPLRLSLVAFLLAGTSVASAQVFVPDDVLTVKPHTVTESIPLGIRAGSFLLSPGVELRSAYDDNIFRTKNNRVSDLVTDVKPAFAVQSDWALHSIFLGGEGDFGYYRNNTQRNFRDYGLIASGQYDITYQTFLTAALTQARRHEDRGSVDDPNGSTPVDYTATTEQMSFTRALGIIKAYITGKNEDDSLSAAPAGANPATASGNFDRSSQSIQTTLSYEYTSHNDIFVTGTYDTTHYKLLSGAGRHSSGEDLRAGIDFAGIGNFSGSAYGGALLRTYSDGTGNTNDPYFGGTLRWTVTPLTTFSAILGKSFNTTTVAGAAGVVHTMRKVTVQQTFTTWLGMDISGGVDDNDYVGNGLALDRNTRLYYSGIGLQYKLSDGVSLRTEYDYRKRTSSLPGDAYQDNRIMLSLVYMR